VILDAYSGRAPSDRRFTFLALRHCRGKLPAENGLRFGLWRAARGSRKHVVDHRAKTRYEGRYYLPVCEYRLLFLTLVLFFPFLPSCKLFDEHAYVQCACH